MILAATLALALAAPQLRIDPDLAVVGHELIVRAERAGAVLAGIEILAETPDGSVRPIGRTDAGGVLGYVPDVAGQHVFRTTVDDLRLVAPCRVVPARSPWLTGLVCVPLGLALLWRNLSRARDRRDP